MNVQWYLTVIWICIFLKINNVERLFLCLFATRISSSLTSLFSSSCPLFKLCFLFWDNYSINFEHGLRFQPGIFVFSLSFKSSSYLLSKRALLNMCCANIFSQSVYSYCHLAMFFKEQFLIFMKFNLLIFSLMEYDLGVVSKDFLPNAMLQRMSPVQWPFPAFFAPLYIHAFPWCHFLG